MMLTLIGYLLAVAIIFGFGYLWYRTSPASGSGWALFAAVFIAICMNSPSNHAVGFVTYSVLAVGSAAGWYFTRSKEYSGWLLAVAILSAFNIMDYLM